MTLQLAMTRTADSDDNGDAENDSKHDSDDSEEFYSASEGDCNDSDDEQGYDSDRHDGKKTDYSDPAILKVSPVKSLE